ncbi:restriction endonuclease subunit S [Endozoicomonas lisbonensis]
MLTASQKYGVIPQKLFMKMEQQKVVQVLKGHDILKKVECGDFVISMRSFQGGIEYCGYSGSISSAYVPLLPRDGISTKYYKYLFKSASYIQALQSTTNLVRDGQALRYSNFVQVRLPSPPKKEGDRIGSFLDHETAKIDQLIQKQEQLITLLKEKRQAVISHAVTKGLTPDAPMKDSGVEWLGEVPEHWIVRRLKHTATLQSGIPKGKDLKDKETINVPMLRVANVQDGYLKLDDVHHIQIEPHDLSRYELQDGDVLMNEGGDNDKLGRGAVWRSEIKPCIHQNHVFAIRPTGIEPEWLDLLTRASYAKFHFYRVAKQSTNLASISSTNIKETPLIIPPDDERRAIMEYLKGKLDKFERLEEKSLRQIGLLKEHRTALISSAVTGKIDVRHWNKEAA